MKLALLTDLHANLEAFDACMDAARAAGAQSFAFLGDFVGYGADPGAVLDRVMALTDQGAIAVLGNHDEACVRGPAPMMDAEAVQVIHWTRSRLSSAQMQFLAGLPMSATQGHCLFVHANAFAPAQWAYIYGRADALRSMHATECRVSFCGHVHEPRLYHLSATAKMLEFDPVPGVPVPLLPTRRWLALPGSAGQPRDGNPAASWALYDTDSLELCFYRVPYDFESAAAKIRAAGLPERFALRLQHGR